MSATAQAASAGPASIFASPQLRALGDPVKPGSAGILYRLGMLLVAAVMLILPLLYVGLIGVVGWLIYLHAIHNTFILGGHGRAAVGRLVGYLMPMIVGVVLILFMIKPLFARQRRINTPLTVTETDQPMLHAFVQKLADAVRAPRPKRIDVDCQVNASAGFDDGIGSFFRGDLVLTVGLPLVEGLTLRQFTAVLSHELGHFAQGGGMRLTYIVRTINGWFARVVYERDAWDDQLAAVSQSDSHWAIQLTAGIARLFVWLSRQVLKVLMICGHVVSSFMLRQMEYDADRYAARVTGSSTVIEMSDKVGLLAVAQNAALSELSSAWKEGRLCDNLPLLIRYREKEMPQDVRQNLVKDFRQVRTGWFDSHPCDADRVKSVRSEAAAGVFKLDAPASSLFKKYEDLSCRATVAFYHDVLQGQVKPENLVPTQSLVKQHGEKQKTQESLNRYFLGMLSPLRPVFPRWTINSIADRAEAAERLMQLRNQFLDAIRPLSDASAEFDKSDDRFVTLSRLRAMINAGYTKMRPREFGLVSGSDDEVRVAIHQAQEQRDTAAGQIKSAMEIGMQRLELALALAATDNPPEAPESPQPDEGEYDLAEPVAGTSEPMRDALQALAGASGMIESIRTHFSMLNMLMSQLQPNSNPDNLISAILAESGKTAKALLELQSDLRAVPYPYELAGKRITMAGYIIPQPPAAEAAGDVHNAANSALDGYYSLYVRILADLSAKAEKLEDDLGLSRLAAPRSRARS